MKKGITITPTLLNEDLTFSPTKYFVSKKSIYPNIVYFSVPRVKFVEALYERMSDKFDEFTTFFKKTSKGLCEEFTFIHDDKENTIIFQYQKCTLYYYSNIIDEGLINILTELIDSCNE